MDEEKEIETNSTKSTTEELVIVVLAAAGSVFLRKLVKAGVEAGFEAYRNRKTTDTE